MSGEDNGKPPVKEGENTRPLNKEERKREQQIKEQESIDREMAHPFYCGSCTLGMESLEVYRQHQDEEEHRFHIREKIASMVPGLGYCQACCCLVQRRDRWDRHTAHKKHIKCVESSKSLAAEEVEEVDFNAPRGCETPGELGQVIDPSEIDHLKIMEWGYNTCKAIPAIGLDHLTKNADMFYCSLCEVDFKENDKNNHMSTKTHRMACLKNDYPEWFKIVDAVPSNSLVRIKYKLNYYAAKIEEIEKESESEEAKKLRDEYFISVIVNKKERTHAVRRSVPMRGRPLGGALWSLNHSAPRFADRGRGRPDFGRGRIRGRGFPPPRGMHRAPPRHPHPGYDNMDGGFDEFHDPYMAYHEPPPRRPRSGPRGMPPFPPRGPRSRHPGPRLHHSGPRPRPPPGGPPGPPLDCLPDRLRPRPRMRAPPPPPMYYEEEYFNDYYEEYDYPDYYDSRDNPEGRLHGQYIASFRGPPVLGPPVAGPPLKKRRTQHPEELYNPSYPTTIEAPVEDDGGKFNDAMHAIETLEKFAVSQGEPEIKAKISAMKDAVLNGGTVNPKELQGLASQMRSKRGAASAGVTRRPPRKSLQ